MPGGPERAVKSMPFDQAVFLFFYFSFSFFTKIYFRCRNLEKYTRPPRCRAAGTWLPRCGAAGAFLQKIRENFCRKAPGGPVARQRGGRPPSSGTAGPGCPAAGRPAPPPLYKGWLVPPLICFTKIPETKKREGGRERGEALLDFQAGDSR